MYTQCPDCKTAFRVTARVLQQAAGRVRCGGCGSAFNALEYLSEELPGDRETSPAADPAQQDVKKKKLLETLDELTGPDNVVIEDTGVEWQVLNKAVEEETASQQDSSDTASMRWTIEKVQNIEPDPEALPEIVNEVPLTRGGGDRRSSAEGIMRFDDNTPLPEDYDDVVTISPPVSPPVPQRREQDKVHIETKHFDELQFDLALGNADEWVNLLDEVDAAEATGNAALSLEVEEELAAIHSELTARPATRGTVAKAPVKTKNEGAEDRDVAAPANDAEDDEPAATASKPLQSTGDFEKEIEVARAALLGEEPDEKPEIAAEDDKKVGEITLSLVEEPVRADHRKTEVAADDDDIAELVLRGELESAAVPEAKPDRRPRERRDTGLKPPPATSEAEAPPKPKYPDHLFDENADNVETIIMEGELVHGSLREQELAAKEASERLGEAAFLADTYSINRNKVRGGKRRSDPAGRGVVATVVVLTIVLAAQVMHNMRQTLSTVGAFNQTIAPIYRLLGQPIAPGWDIKGWQFLETSNTMDDSGKLLTIRSRVVNRSAQALPYPLVHVSLTDRWEEIVGSDVLEPKEYLTCDPEPNKPVGTGDPDPRISVPAGGEFTAVICIDSPSTDATGFKLNVCYRVDSEQLRCATEDFKE